MVVRQILKTATLLYRDLATISPLAFATIPELQPQRSLLSYLWWLAFVACALWTGQQSRVGVSLLLVFRHGPRLTKRQDIPPRLILSLCRRSGILAANIWSH